MCTCDGLILVSVRDRLHFGTTSRKPFVLWNPSIRSYKRISCPYELPFSSLYGLCYDSTVAEYRVFIVSQENETSVVVYHLRNDSWNIFIDNRYILSSSRINSWNIFIDNHYVLSSLKHHAVMNGTVHWVMRPYNSVSSVIVYFDLVEEKFIEVPPPSSWNKDDEMNLVVLREHLCVYGDIGVKQIEVCPMKEYGKKESWTRLFVIRCGILKRIHSSTDVKPLCLTKNGQVLMSLGKRGVGIYNPKDCTFLVYDCDRGWMPMPPTSSPAATAAANSTSYQAKNPSPSLAT
ncbi:hypothetical protein Vadar_017678 [Vaccinium darrowii]|uniref:Uncharacterized protein n=1 Tax=Vaccinium darrowii TaxID=229202 RepID=A0ACB7X234_9ERIC|nr:hypothetical protein Vadar_017678 [Vaccinium darrowii]